MPRPKKDQMPLNMRISTTVYEKMVKSCEESGQTRTTAVERALSMYVDDFNKKKKFLEENMPMLYK